MTPRSDPLLEAIRAAPNDHAPRLVWADREGGDRGEFVVISCALATRGIDRDTRLRYSERAKELTADLERWTGLPGLLRSQCDFKLGFVDRIHVEQLDTFHQRLDRVAEHAPLLGGLEFRQIAEPSNSYLGPRPMEAWDIAMKQFRDVMRRFDALSYLRLPPCVQLMGDWSDPGDSLFYGDAFINEVLADEGLGAKLGALELPASGVTSNIVAKIGSLPSLQRLMFGAHSLHADDIIAIVERLPHLYSLFLGWSLDGMTSDDVSALIESKKMRQVIQLELQGNRIPLDDAERFRMALGSNVKCYG